MKIKIDQYSLFVFLVPLYSLSVMLYSVIDVLFPMSRILGGIVVVDLIYMYVCGLRKKDLFMIGATCFLSLITLVNASDQGRNCRDLIYWLTTVFLLWKMTDDTVAIRIFDKIKEAKRYIAFIVAICDMVIMFQLLFGIGYTKVWGGVYFTGFAVSNHVLACGCCLCIAMSMFIIDMFKNKFIYVLFVLPFFIAILQSGARTYMVSFVVLLFVIYKVAFKKFKLKLLVLPIAVAVVITFFMKSGMLNKFINPNAYFSNDSLNSMTSGRSEFWMIDLKAFADFNIYNKIVGNGFDYPYFVNRTEYGFDIWSHNDFIECLLSVGLIGTMVYIFSIIKFIITLMRKNKKFIGFIVMVYFVFVAFVNGLFAYQHYFYSFLFLYIFVLCGNDSGKENRLIPRKSDG